MRSVCAAESERNANEHNERSHYDEFIHILFRFSPRSIVDAKDAGAGPELRKIRVLFNCKP